MILDDLNLVSMVIDGGAVAIVIYAFYILLTTLNKSHSKNQGYVERLQEKYIEDIKEMTRSHAAVTEASHKAYRDDVRQITGEFNTSIRDVRTALVDLSKEVNLIATGLNEIREDRELRARRDNLIHKA